MKILLLGEYSNVHWTLAEGLRTLGHEVTVLSDGDSWKNYPRDISLTRTPSKISGMAYLFRLITLLPRLRGYDIVQLINPIFLELKPARIVPIYRYLRSQNRQVVLGAFGMDYYWVNTCSSPESPFLYSDFNLGRELRTNADAERERAEWIDSEKGRLNQWIAQDADAIVAGLYEYWRCYEPVFKTKTLFIPYPIRMEEEERSIRFYTPGRKVRIFIGISRSRNEYKGTDIMLRAAQDVCARYPERMELQVVTGVPFRQYCEMMEASDMILDQLYSYTPAMNALQAMSRGIVCVGGGEPEHYDLLNEHELRPIINVRPDYESVYKALEAIALHPEKLPELQRQSVAYVRKHHDYIRVARAYEALYRGLLWTCPEGQMKS